MLTPRKSRYLRQRVTGLLCIPDQGAVAELVGAAGEDLNAATESWNYGSILLTFRDMTTGRTTDDGLQGDRCRQPTHIWPLRRASYIIVRPPRWTCIRRQLGRDVTAKLVTAFVLSHLDHCNAVLFCISFSIAQTRTVRPRVHYIFIISCVIRSSMHG